MFRFDPSLVFESAACAANSILDPSHRATEANAPTTPPPADGTPLSAPARDPTFAGWPAHSISSSAYKSQSKSPFMYASPNPMSARRTVFMNIFWSYTVTDSSGTSYPPSTASFGGSPGISFPRIFISAPFGRIILNVRFGGTQLAPTRLNSGSASDVVRFKRGSHRRGVHGTDAPGPPIILSNTSTADLIPSSWKPYPSHAPANHTPPSPWNLSLIAVCASIARALKSGWLNVTRCCVVPVAGGRGGLSVTNKSGSRSGKFCSRFTQYVTHTLASSPLAPREEPFRQFHDAHAFLLRGMSVASRWSHTSFF
mmetsp:Transcript_708/g.2298  ORF Transcript_708/g.2298 Transcript_708/m.2298 type:complete len:312 (+) Transcript_708:1547-2482(+)